MTRAPRLSPGRLTALWVILRALSRFGGSAKPAALKTLAARTALRSGGLPINDGYELGIVGGFLLQPDQSSVVLGPAGTEALGLNDEDEPNPDVLRLFLSVLMLKDPPTWVAFWQGDPSSLDVVLPESDRRLLERADLFPPPPRDDLRGWGWWKALTRVPLPEETAAFRKVIGDAGEELSIRYERKRLTSEGFPELARQIRWVGQESPAYGYDVASFWGRNPLGVVEGSKDPHSHLAIEVKSASSPVEARFPLYLSSHEWEIALDLGERYVFHLWDGVNPQPDLRARREKPISISPLQVQTHLPAAALCEEACHWQTTYVELPL